MIEPASHDPGARLAAVRTQVRAAESGCRLLYPLLTTAGEWHGPAAGAFRGRIAGLRERIDAALAAIEAAEAEL